MNHVTNFREQFYRSFTFTDNTKWNYLGESFLTIMSNSQKSVIITVLIIIFIIITIIVIFRMVNPRAPILSCRASLARNLAGYSLGSGNAAIKVYLLSLVVVLKIIYLQFF
jgi:hypothetical protein